MSADKQSCQFDIRVQSTPFNIADEINSLRKLSNNIGAIVSFSGLCRDEEGSLNALQIEHYPAMAEAQIRTIAEEAAKRWPLYALSLIHRYGIISAGDDIVLVVVASIHRQAAFDAASFIMDYLKTDAPFWKKELYKDNRSTGWVEAHEQDNIRRKRW